MAGVRTSGAGPDTLADVDPVIGSTSLMKFAARNILVLGLVVGSAQASSAAGCGHASALPGETLHVGADTLLVGGNQSRDHRTGHREIAQRALASRCDRGYAPSDAHVQPAGGPNPSVPVKFLVRGEQQEAQRGHRERNRHRFHGGHWRGHPHPHPRQGWRGHPHPHPGWRGPWSGPRWHRKPHRRPHPGVFWHWHGRLGWHWHWPFAHHHRHPHSHGRGR